MLLSTLLHELNYEQSSHYRSNISEFGPETAHLFRAAHDAGVSGIYVFEASPNISQKVVADRPAVYIAQAENAEQARRIHRSLWNLGYAPFLIVLLPHQVRIYTGFDYSEEDTKKGLLDEFPLNDIRFLLAEFSSEAIDTGRIWQKSKYKNQLDQQQRVDNRLLRNLRQLGKELRNRDLDSSVAHALIGKYVYIRYLWDRGILTEEWLQEQHIAKESVFSRVATAGGLSRLTTALENRFNGKIFPIDFMRQGAPSDLHVQLTASVFMGDETILESKEAIIRQLHLDFQAYDFAYIPIEILSEVYEQFIEDSKKKGAIYTPEILADYLLSEISTVKPLTEETKILDPACGSGVFLVLAYRRLIEAELAKDGESKLSPEKLKALLSNLFGVERELDACYVTEFSLILTLLNYVDPRELQKIEFRFPELHNNNIFHSDFFDLEGTHYEGKFWQQGLKFDWIIGNPPWIELKGRRNDEELARKWIASRTNKSERPISGNRIAEAFSWLVTDLLYPEGIVGLILPATSLFNLEARNYRKQFFTRHQVFRITNFANLREVLFPKNTYPAVTIVYSPVDETEDKPPIIHYAPLSVNQITGVQNKPWVITINENEIQAVNASAAESGETVVWKLALWGTFQDKRAIECIDALFPLTLNDLCDKRNWPFYQGAELRNRNFYPEVDFLIPPRQMGIAAPEEDANILCALSMYLNSSLVSYYLFFHAQQWGVFRQAKLVSISEMRKVPIPDFTQSEVEELVELCHYLVNAEKQSILEALSKVKGVQLELLNSNQTQASDDISVPDLLSEVPSAQKNQITKEVAEFHATAQRVIDEKIFELFAIPEDIRMLVTDFVQVRLLLDRPAAFERVIREPDEQELLDYARELRDELDGFVEDDTHHGISITYSPDLIECIIDVVDTDTPITLDSSRVRPGDLTSSRILSELSRSLREQVSQWIYVQRGLRLFDGPRIHLYKSPRLIDWTRTQAMNDAGDILGEVLTEL